MALAFEFVGVVHLFDLLLVQRKGELVLFGGWLLLACLLLKGVPATLAVHHHIILLVRDLVDAAEQNQLVLEGC